MNRTHNSSRVGMSRRNPLAKLGAIAVGALAFGLLSGCGGEDNTSSNNVDPTTLPYSGTLVRANDQERTVVQQFLALNPPPVFTSVVQARSAPSFQQAAQLVAAQQGKTYAQPVASVRDTTINVTEPTGTVALPVRVYTPTVSGTNTNGLPILVYFHGGGFVIATIDTYDASARALANAAQCVVVSVEYRKAPENKFPAQQEDAYAATQYVIANAASFGGNATRVAVGGESAGGNLAATTCLLARDRNGSRPVYQLLIYPVASTNPNTPSKVTNANAIPLNVPNLNFFVNNTIRSTADLSNPLLNLVGANLQNLPPATVITDDIDPLMSEGQQLAQALQSAGVTVRSQNYSGVSHEFFGLGSVIDTANDAVSFAADGLRTAFTNNQ